MNKQDRIEAAKALAELTARTLKANEIIWMDAWRAAPNPFVAINQYKSPKQRGIRKPIIDAWLEAAAVYEAIKPTLSTKEKA